MNRPRPPLSLAEFETAQTIKKRLEALGFAVQEQPFFTTGRLLQRLGPAGLITSLGISIGLGETRQRRYLGTAIASLAAWGLKQIQNGRTAFWEYVLPQQRTTNLIARISPIQTLEKRVVLIAHLDTDRVRLASRLNLNEYLPHVQNLLQGLTAWSVGVTLEAKRRWLRKLVVGAMLLQMAELVADETGSPSMGANDNASGIAVLLNIADYLGRYPPKHTEVILAFTSCDTLGGRGTAELAQEYGKAWQDAHWVIVDSVGLGELCWMATEDSTTSTHLKKIAAEHPAWGVMKRSLAIPDPTLPLIAHELDAVALIGYERASRLPAHWQSAIDTEIDSECLAKATDLLTTLLKRVDHD